MSKYVAFNFITGQYEPIPDENGQGPTSAWVQGWEAYMLDGPSERNPYDPTTNEGHDWEDGYEAARKD